MFILQEQNRQFGKFAHISLLQVIGNPMPKEPKGIKYMQ